MNPNPELSPRILLMGCGAVGGVIAAGLLESGYDVTLVTHNESISSAIATHGLRAVTPHGTHPLSPKMCAALTHSDLTSVSGSFDIVLLAMKATGVEAAARRVQRMLAPDAIVVTLQNGIVEDLVASIVGRERVIGALVGWGATMHGPGIYERTSRGEMTIGELNGRTTERVQRLKTLLDAAAPTAVSTNIYGALWSKLAINCVVTTFGATTGQLLGQMLRLAGIRRLALSVISEVIDVATALGVTLEPVGGTLDLQRLYLPPSRRDSRLRLSAIPKHAIIGLVGLKFRKLKSSMLQSLERGREPEIDFLNGYVVERGRENGVSTPVNAALTTMVQQIVCGERQIRPQNLEELWKQPYSLLYQ